ncbi:MAG: rod shape-determining protein, partial [Planctomycetes bacterium]|nr:rod shape-determining protein [Planctomycetota bacterium]
MLPEEHSQENGSSPPRIGVDLGAHETRMAFREGPGGEERVVSVPTLLSYSRKEAEPVRFSCIGEKALARRDHMRLVHPYRSGLEGRGLILRDFAHHLRELYQRRGEPAPWAVVSCSTGASEEEKAMKRTVSNEVFDRVLFVDDMFLLALGLASQEVSQHSILIDVGSSSIRAALMHGEAPASEERVEVPHGGARVDEALRRGFALRYPELLLTGWTLTTIKESLSFVAPARRRCLLKIEYRGKGRVLDVTDIVQEASTTIVRPLLRAVREVLALCPSDEIEAFQRNILLVGGGAEVPGIAERVEEELRADGFELARVRKPAGARRLVVKGALRWAAHLHEDQWSIPLFS